MSEDFIVSARLRDEQGKGASRRLRREGLVPGILYGGGEAPAMLALNRNEMDHHLANEAFYSHILTVKVEGKDDAIAVLKDVQRHPAKEFPIHIDLQRVVAGQAIRMQVPLHFLGEDVAPGVKLQGGVVNHHLIDVEISCLPRNLPEYIEVDVSALEVDDSLRLSDLVVPEGVELVALAHDDDTTVVSIHIPRAVVEEEPTDEAEEGAADADEDGDEGDEDKDED